MKTNRHIFEEVNLSNCSFEVFCGYHCDEIDINDSHHEYLYAFRPLYRALRETSMIEEVYDYANKTEEFTTKKVRNDVFNNEITSQKVGALLTRMVSVGLLNKEKRTVKGTITWPDGTTTKLEKKIVYYSKHKD